MTVIRRRLDLASVPQLSDAERVRLDAMTPDEVERNAIEDQENPPLTDEELDRGILAGRVRHARESTKLSQRLFAEKYGIALGRLRDWEQGRFRPDTMALAYLTVIEREPKAVERALNS